MAAHNDTGKSGESIAAAYLQQRGYEILHQNWKYTYYEIDLIAKKENKVHFVEVKTRRSNYYGYPEESVTKKKFKNLQKAADAYLQQHSDVRWIQYDVLSITLHANGRTDYYLLEDVFL